MKTAILLASLLLTSSAFAYERGVSTYDFDSDVSTRSGTYCKLQINGEDVYKGLCNVSRAGDISRIDTGTSSYLIRRDPGNKYSATFSSTNGRYIDHVTANGPCWVGSIIRYCAK